MPPPTKKCKRAGPVRSRPSRNPDLGLELLGRVSTFLPLTLPRCESGYNASSGPHNNSTLMNMCLSVGREDAIIIRRSYLRGNDSYLCFILNYFVHHLGNVREDTIDVHRQKALVFCQTKAAEWIKVNTDWRDRITDEKIKRFEDVWSKNEPCCSTRIIHPDAILNNPAVAIAFGLTEVLSFLVEAKGININELRWSDYTNDLRLNLVITAMGLHSPSFGYLISQKVDMSAPASSLKCDDLSLFQYMVANPHVPPEILQKITKRPYFDPYRPTFINGLKVSALFMLVELLATFRNLDEEEHSPRVLEEKISILLSAGADPNGSFDMAISPMVRAKEMLRKDPSSRIWCRIVSNSEKAITPNSKGEN